MMLQLCVLFMTLFRHSSVAPSIHQQLRAAKEIFITYGKLPTYFQQPRYSIVTHSSEWPVIILKN